MLNGLCGHRENDCGECDPKCLVGPDLCCDTSFKASDWENVKTVHFLWSETNCDPKLVSKSFCTLGPKCDVRMWRLTMCVGPEVETEVVHQLHMGSHCPVANWTKLKS